MTPALPSALCSYANLLLIVATVLYLLFLAWRAPLIGSLASGSAALGVAGLALALTEHWRHPAVNTTPYDMAFVLSAICAITVLTYLIMEKWYGSRTMGAFVMPVVAIAATFQVLGGTHQTITLENSKVLLERAGTQVYILINVSFFCATAIAALYGGLYLWRQRHTRPMFAAISAPHLETSMAQAMSLGFVLYTLAQILRVRFSGMTFDDDWSRYQHSCTLLGIWCFYLFCQILHGPRRSGGHFMAGCAIAGFFLGLIVFPELRSAWQG